MSHQSHLRRFELIGILTAVVLSGTAHAASLPEEDARFAVADVSPARAPATVLDRIERETATSRPGLQLVEDATMRTLLRDAESAAVTTKRQLGQARTRRLAGDCAAALTAATAAEAQALDLMTLDEQRAPLREAYTTILLCEHALGHEDRAAAAARSLHLLTSLRPDDVPEALWQRYVKTAANAQQAELRIDSEPPNAHVTVDFHDAGFTPCTVKQAQGTALVQIEKRGYKRGLRRVTAGGEPTRVSFTLAERRNDRTTSVRDLIVALRGREPDRDRTLLARLAQLARADVLVLVSASEGTLRVWTFDAERGEVTSSTRPMKATGGL